MKSRVYFPTVPFAALGLILNGALRRLARSLLLYATAMVLAACASLSGKAPEITSTIDAASSTFFFECEDQYVFVARTREAHVWLFLDDVTVNLPRRLSASGEKYQSAEYLFWNKGGEALLKTADGKQRQCKNNRARAVWEAAKLNGVDFRAVGNEPGWFLELSGDLLVLETDYGASRYEFSTPPADVDAVARLTRYQVTENGRNLLLELKGSRCRDTMTGEDFPTSVSVTLDARVFQGCGRALH